MDEDDSPAKSKLGSWEPSFWPDQVLEIDPLSTIEVDNGAVRVKLNSHRSYDQLSYTAATTCAPDGSSYLDGPYDPGSDRPHWRFWIHANNIFREVMMTSFGCYLGGTAQIRPYTDPDDSTYSEKENQCLIACYRNFPQAQIDDLRRDSMIWSIERQQGNTVSYDRTQAHNRRNYYGPSTDTGPSRSPCPSSRRDDVAVEQKVKLKAVLLRHSEDGWRGRPLRDMLVAIQCVVISQACFTVISGTLARNPNYMQHWMFMTSFLDGHPAAVFTLAFLLFVLSCRSMYQAQRNPRTRDMSLLLGMTISVGVGQWLGIDVVEIAFTLLPLGIALGLSSGILLTGVFERQA